MKTRFKHLSKSTISIILAVVMVVSTFTVSIVATNAAYAGDGVGASSNAAFTAGDVYYLDVRSFSDKDNWCSDNVGAVFFYQNNTDWCCETNSSSFNGSNTETVTKIEEYVYSVTVPAGYTSGALAFFRYSNSNDCWNVTKLTADDLSGKNCIKVTGWGTGTASTYTPPTPQTVNYGVHSSGNGTLAVSPATSTGASGGTINSGTSVTFTASPSPGYTVAGWYSNSACTTAISGASGTTYTTTISGTTNVYVKFAEATWPPFNFTNSDSNKLRYAHSTDANDIRNEKCSYWDNELKTDGNGHWWIDVTANINDFVTDLANSPYKKLYFRLENSSGNTWYDNISITTTNSPGVTASTGSTNQDSTTYKYAAITEIQSGYTVNHIGAYMYVEQGTLHVDFYSDGTNATNNKVYFKGLGDTWSGTGPEGTQVGNTAEYTYVVQQSDIVTGGNQGAAFYFRVLYKGEEYAPTGSTDVLLTENTQVTTTNKDTNGAFYFPGANVGATIHASLSGSTLTVWYTSAHTYYDTPEYYVVGRFKVKDGSASGTEYYTKNGENGAWSSTLTESADKFQFSLDNTETSGTDTTLTYSLDTHETLGELSPFVWGTETRQTPYVFAVYDRNYHFGESSNSGKGKAFINYRADTSALSLEKYVNLTENNEMQFEDPDNSNGTVVLHLKVIGTTGEGGTIDLGTAKYSIWYTIDGAKPYAVDVAKLTASPSAVAQGGKIKLTASYTGAQSLPENLRYTFQKLNPTTFKYETISGNDPLPTNVFEYEETTVGTNEYRVLISSVTQEGTADKYYPRAATTQASCYVAGLYMSNNIATIPDNTTWDSTDMKSTSFRKVTTASSYTNSNPYEFAFSTINGSFDVNAPLFALDPDGNNQNCKIEYSTEVVTIDGVEKAVRTYKVIPNTKCSNPIIYLDIANKKLYATCTYNGATEEKTSEYDNSEFVTYYFAEQVGHENDTNASTNAHQSAAGTGKGMRIRYWNASVQEGGANDFMGEVDVYEQAKVRKSDGTYTANTIFVNMTELYAKNVQSTAQQFYVYKVKLPVRATSFSILNLSGSPIEVGFLNSIDFTSTTASNTLNPNRIYLYYLGTGPSANTDKWASVKGIILDDHLWTANTSGSATNQVSTKNVDATLINYTDIGTDPRVDLGNKEVNQSALAAYTAKGTPHALYFGDFTTYGTLDGYSNYVHWKNVAQHNNDKSYFAIVKDLVGMTLSKTQMNANGYPMLLDTQGNNSANGLSQAQLMPLFDYNTVTTAINGKKIATSATQQLNFPMNRSTHNGITTYSYDSTTDWNRIWDGTIAKDFVIQGDEGTNTGYRNHYAYGKDGKGLADTGFFPFGGNNDQVTGTGFGTEFDLKFYMTNTGYLTESDGTTNEDIAFNFSGDDDVWVYVDGVKVLDLGGAHKTAAASINFTDMKVYYKVAGNSANGSGITSTTDSWASENDYVKTVDLKELLSAYGQEFDPKDATKQHTLQMFYMERGAYESNCSLSYNLPQASGLSIKNNVTADNVNIALKTAALYAAVPDYFTYQLSAKKVDSNTPVITGTPAPNTRGDLSNTLPQYQYNYETYYTYKDGVHSDIQYKLSKAHSGTTTGGTLPTYSASNYTNAGNVVYALSGNVTATTEGKAFPTGQTDADGTFYLLNNQMANFDSKVPANSYVKIAQKQALGEADTGAANTDREGLLVYGSVPNNNVGNYYLTSYSIYDEKAKKYIAGAENSPVNLPLNYGDNDDYYAADTDNSLGETGAFYFSNYSGSTDDLNSAMKVDFYNDIAVGDIRIEKQLAENATSNSFFIFDIEFRDIFGDDTDSDWNKYDGLEYWVYNENGDLAYPSAQYYTARTGIQLRAGEYALIKGIPVESRYRISERSTVGFSFNKYDLKTYMNDGDTEVDVLYGGTHYKFSDSSTTSSTTDSDTILYTENENNHEYKYYKTMIPTVSQSQRTSGDREDYGATAKIVYTNAKENISIVFKYYDRDVTNNKPASIKESPTEYSYKFDNLEKYTYYKAINDSKIADVMADEHQTTYSQEQVTAYNNIEVGGFVCIDFEAILKENAIIFEGDVQLQNLIDNYYMWTTQAAALAAMQTKPNLHANNEGNTNYTAAEAVYHTKSDGTPNSAGEKWVTYYNGKAQAVDAENFTFAVQSDYDSVRSIVVWLYNVPQSYDVKVYGVKDTGNGFNAANYVHAATNPKVLGAYVANNTGYYQENATTAYYSQRVGRPLNDPDYLDALAYMKAYNFSGIVPNFIPKNMTDESITLNPGANDEQTLQFAYWSYNSDGSTVASTEWSYGYRITNNVNLYAVYAPEKMDTATRGLTITQDKDDNYVDADPTTHAGVARTRLNVMFTPYNCPDYDTNIKYAGLVNIYVTNLVKQLRAKNKSDEEIEETIKGLQAKYADQLKSYLATYAAFSKTLNYDYITPTITLTAKGYVYNALGTGSPSVQLTNKNRVEFTTDFKTSALYPDKSKANHNCVGILQIGAMCYDDDGTPETTDWILSDNCIVRLFKDED